MRLPNSWNDITVEIYREWKIYEKGAGQTPLFEFMVNKLQIITDTDDGDPFFDDLDIDELISIMSKLKFTNHDPVFSVHQKVGYLHKIDFKKIKLGEFVDLEVYFRDPYENFLDVLSIIYRPFELNKFNNIQLIPQTEVDLNKSKHFISELPVTSIIGAFNEYVNFRQHIFDVYKSQFNYPDNDLTDEEKQSMTREEIIEAEKEIKEEQNKSRWGYEYLIYETANGDLTKFDQVTELPLILVLNIRAMKQDLKIQ